MEYKTSILVLMTNMPMGSQQPKSLLVETIEKEPMLLFTMIIIMIKFFKRVNLSLQKITHIYT